LRHALASGPVLIDFWATWCQPCLKALPKLDEIEDLYSPRGLKVVAVNEDGPRNLSRIRPFLKSRKLDFRVLLDLNSTVMNSYRIDSIPTTVLVDSSGEIVYFHRGYKPGDEVYLKRAIDELLQ
jgi:thiol-disulfide isomerase/thioredoxin